MTPTNTEPGAAPLRVIDNLTLVPSRYGETDIWTSIDQLERVDVGEPRPWIELRMRCRYTRRAERFSILYTGPHGATRVEHGAAPVPGPHGALIPQATVIAAGPVERAEIIDVEEGDVLVLNGQRMVIIDDRLTGYPRLATEPEWGLAIAQREVRNHISTIRTTAKPDDPTVRALYDLLRTLIQQADRLRAAFRPAPVESTTE